MCHGRLWKYIKCTTLNFSSFIYQQYNINISNSYEALAGIPGDHSVFDQSLKTPTSPFMPQMHNSLQGPISMSLFRLSLLVICPFLARIKPTAGSPNFCLAKHAVDVSLDWVNCEQAPRQQKAAFVIAQQKFVTFQQPYGLKWENGYWLFK